MLIARIWEEISYGLSVFLLMILLSLSFNKPLKAQELEPTEAQSAGREDSVNLEKIIVTNRRAEALLSDASENVTVISEEEIKSMPARNLSEALSYISGVDIEPRQGIGQAATLSIQGSDSRQVRVMIDGIPLNSLASGQVNPVMFPIENIERIEIIKGSSSSAWGSALGGVINIITKDTGKTLLPKGNLTASFAEFRTQKESFDLSGKAGDLGYYLLSSYTESGGKGPKKDVLEKKGFTKLSYDLGGNGKVVTAFGYSGAEVNSGRFPDDTWVSQPYRVVYGKAGWEGNLKDTEVKIDFKHSRQRVITKFYDSILDDAPSSRVEAASMLYQLSLNSAAHLRKDDLLAVGADFDSDVLKSTYLLKAKNVTLQAPYINYTLKLDPWSFNSGLRYDNNSEFGGQLSPSFGINYQLQDFPDTRIRAEASRAFNAPPLLWKYYDQGLSGITTNPDIKPERAWVYETGLESRPIEKLWLKFSVYRSDVKDAIALSQNDSGLYFMKNFEKFRRQGAELQFKLNIFKGFDFSAAAAFNDIEDRSTKQTARGGGKPRQSFDLGIDYKKNGFNLSLKSYYDRWNEPATSEPNDRKMLLDLRIAQGFKICSLFLNIYNLTNSKYWADFFFPVQERYFEGGITFNW